MTLTFRYNARPWSLNSERSGSWPQRARQTKEWREAFAWLALAERHPMLLHVHVQVRVGMRSPIADTGNCFGASKAAVDGLVDAKLLPADTPDVVRSLTFFAPVKDVSDWLELTVIPTDSGGNGGQGLPETRAETFHSPETARNEHAQ